MKGYMRPDGTSYYVTIPKPIRELFGLEGGEYFLMKTDAKDGEIELKLVDFEEDIKTTEDSLDPTVMAEEVEEPSQLEAGEHPKEKVPKRLDEH